MEIKWHKVDEKPHYDEKDLFKNMILVCGEHSFGKGMSVCQILDNDATIYAPISGKEHKWEDIYFTYWAYCHEFYPIEQLKNS